MNIKLKREIINHIFAICGILSDNSISNRFITSLLSKDFAIDKKISFEDDENKKYENLVYAASATIEGAQINILIADLAAKEKEYTLVCQMEREHPYALRLSEDKEDFGDFYVCIDGHWIAIGTTNQAKLLIGFESLSEVFPKWSKMTNYKEIYGHLVKFLEKINE